MSWFSRKPVPFGPEWCTFILIADSETSNLTPFIYNVPFNFYLHLLTFSCDYVTPLIVPGGGSFVMGEHFRAETHLSMFANRLSVGSNVDVHLHYIRNQPPPIGFGPSGILIDHMAHDIYLNPHDTLKISLVNAASGARVRNQIFFFRLWEV